MSGSFGDFGDYLAGGGAGADDSHALAFQADVMVPAGSVEHITLVSIQALDVGVGRVMQNTRSRHHKIYYQLIFLTGCQMPFTVPIVAFIQGFVETHLVGHAVFR